MNLAPNGADPTEEIYRSRAWNELPFRILNEPIDIPAGGGLYYTCDYQNRSDLDIKFGPRVDTDEHCNLFAYFYSMGCRQSALSLLISVVACGENVDLAMQRHRRGGSAAGHRESPG